MMKFPVIFAVVSGFCIAGFAHTDISIPDANDMMSSSENLIIIDIREYDEYCGEYGHIPDAIIYPWSSNIFQEAYKNLPKDAKILLVCRSGRRSDAAAEFLDSRGYQHVYNLLGGTRDWKNKYGYETIDETLPENKGIVSAYNELILADHWRKTKAAAEKLSAFGEDALPTIIKGTRHKRKMVRDYCYQNLRSAFSKNKKSIAAIINGLNDKEQSISYPCAFHLGEHRVSSAKAALQICMKDESKDARTRCAAAKSLAELGDDDVMAWLYTGLGSDDHYTRYISNIGIKALCGKDLTDFEYEGPWEGAMVSGPAVYKTLGQPIEKAKKKIERLQAIVKFLQWLEKKETKLFKKLG